MIGLSVYSFDLWDINNLGKKRGFLSVFAPKYIRMMGFGKEIIISEMGVTGTEEYKTSWIQDAKMILSRLPMITGVIYFNSPDMPNTWGEDVPTPDWGVHNLQEIFKL